jgi:hypothetical protein
MKATVKLAGGFENMVGTACLYWSSRPHTARDELSEKEYGFRREIVESPTIDSVISAAGNQQDFMGDSVNLIILRENDHPGYIRFSSTEKWQLNDAVDKSKAYWLKELLQDGTLVSKDRITGPDYSLFANNYLQSDYGPRKDPKVLYERIMREEDALNELLGRIFKQDGAGED